MKITKSKLRRILREEVEKFINETVHMGGLPFSHEDLILVTLLDYDPEPWRLSPRGMSFRNLRTKLDLLHRVKLSDDELADALRDLGKEGLVFTAGEGVLEPHEIRYALTGDGKTKAIALRNQMEGRLGEVAVPDPTSELHAMQKMVDRERGPQAVKKMKDYEDGVHTGVASLVDVIDLVEEEEED